MEPDKSGAACEQYPFHTETSLLQIGQNRNKTKDFKKVPPCRRVPGTPTNEKICFPQAFWHGLKPTSGWAKFHPAFCAGTTVLRPARGQHSANGWRAALRWSAMCSPQAKAGSMQMKIPRCSSKQKQTKPLMPCL